MFNNSNQMYGPNPNTKDGRVDVLLKGIGAEPLFSSINEPTPGVPNPLNGPNNYNKPPAYNPVQQDQTAVLENVIMSLFQSINQQNPQNTQTSQSFQNSQNPQSFQNQNFNQNLSQNQNFNQNFNQSNLSNQIIPNPISILNEMHQRQKTSTVPPKYDFTMDPTTGNFYCQLEVFGRTFRTERPTLRKQQAKEDAALMAIRSFASNNNSNSLGNERCGGSDITKLYEQSSFNNNCKNDTICRSELWYNRQSSESPGKQPRVILLEFCQMHRLPTPSYQPFNDYNGNTYFECAVGDKTFKSDRTFMKSNEARDYVAAVAFESIFKEMCEIERRQRVDVGYDARSSLLNFIDNSINNNNSMGNRPQSHVTSINGPHTNTMSGPLPNITGPHIMNSSHSNVTNMTSNPLYSHSSITSPHSPISTNNTNSLFNSPISSPSPHLHLNSHLDVNNSHLNEIPNSYLHNHEALPSYNEIPNIKVESEDVPDLSFIKTEEGSISFPARDQFQQPIPTSSQISYHPYNRAPGRERFPPNPGGFNGLNSNVISNINNNSSVINTINTINNNSQLRKNCKKFTSLLYEMAQSRRWSPPEFNFENSVSGFTCTCSIQDYFFRGKAYAKKADAKESAAEEAYRLLTRNGV